MWVCLVDAERNAASGAEGWPRATAQGPFRSKSSRVTVGNGGGDLRIDGKRRDTPDRAEPLGYIVRPSGIKVLPAAAGRPVGDPLSVRAGLVVTGTEVLAGRVQRPQRPVVADRLAELGVELAHVLITGDRREDLLSALSFMRAEGTDLILTSGGLGPTADDMTAEIVGRLRRPAAAARRGSRAADR